VPAAAVPAVPAVAAIVAVPLLAWVYLFAWHGGYWRTDQRLPPPDGAHGGVPASHEQPGGHARHWPSVVAVVPARDEAAILPLTLPTLLTQDYPGPFEVVLVDDRSGDGTASVAADLASRASRAGPAAALRVVTGQQCPDGWAGKVWAMQQGVRAAGDSEYLLFTDADIAYEPGMLTALVDAAVAGGRDLVSQMALLRAQTAWERILVPAFVYFFAQLYPFRRVNRPGGRTAAAAGGCMLVRRQVLAQAGGLPRIRGALIDDVALGHLLKRSPVRGRCWLGFGTGVVSRRPYPRLAELWQMVARSAYYQLRYSPVLLAGTIAGMLWLYLAPPVAAMAGLAGAAAGGGSPAWWCAAAGLAGWLIMAATYLPVLRLYRLSPLRAVGLPLIALGYAAMTFDSARQHWAGRGGTWKGRPAVRGGAVTPRQTAPPRPHPPYEGAVHEDP
jgi:hopene-associated glycosyltransferase HpnB